ncbi:hypothetical protein [Gilvibacter sediminis]|uniref:hypothetical protein n=1 Tax=Gilvibacter sediminis TaxID=379071 RepID=UPI00234FFA79|nr:hypothetical protein [Gilvibacter sediminis]MDC7996748.1 hypothetical protein [Gilvibacter sediminis]
MSDKKHIDRIFQEGFKDFEATPPPEVWEGIQAALKKEEKEDRKIIPIWWRAGGVAALLALLLTVGGVFWPDSEPANSFSTEDNIPAEQTEDATGQDQKPSTDLLLDNGSIDAVADGPNDGATEGTIEQASEADAKRLVADQKDAVATQGTQQTNIQKGIDKTALDTAFDAQTTGVATTDSTKDTNDNEQDTGQTTTAVAGGADTQTTVVDDKTADTLLESQTGGATTTAVTVDEEISKDPEVSDDQEGKISIFDAIEDQKDTETALELNDQDNLDQRWSVVPQAAPVVYGSFGEGSTVGSEFADNSTSADANLSYGVQVQYQVNNRLAVRSGVNRVNLSVNTNDIEFAVAPAAFNVGSKFVNGQVAYSVGDKGTLANRFAQAAPTEGLDIPPIDAFEGFLNQQFEYWEVPLELSYAVVNNRFKVNVFGGFSTLFLQDNSITAVSGQRETTLGSVGNLNSLSFTTNVGMGLQYDISKRFAINVEPVFKYQLNPYSDSSIGSQPYYMGVYSGLRFSF